MGYRQPALAPLANVIVLSFPVLLLCVPRGAGVFIGLVLPGALLANRRLAGAWRTCRAELRPLGLAILAVLTAILVSPAVVHGNWNMLDNSSRLSLATAVEARNTPRTAGAESS
ncbi:hypothetical protein [Cupriavidus sp. RAF12]|uniref:hypothetical protein n=1 Tax=Cupriavidus sp. RAF12 TaxID=3233050 RepID=UPI003F92E1E7